MEKQYLICYKKLVKLTWAKQTSGNLTKLTCQLN